MMMSVVHECKNIAVRYSIYLTISVRPYVCFRVCPFDRTDKRTIILYLKEENKSNDHNLYN